MIAGEKPKFGRPAVLAVLGAALVLALSGGLAAWLIPRGRVAPRPEERTLAPPADPPVWAAADPPSTPIVQRQPAAGPDEPRPEGGPIHPHPITPQHERIFRENALIGAFFGAMDVGDSAGVRRLADEYRREYPDDPSQLQRGYDVIADCFEHPGPDAKAAGQRYYDEERGSILRRFVARHCLGFEL